ncbi:MAG: Sigma 54 modulation protein / ribosomal protein [Pseudomonadota bacterium]|jgi:ribosome-associated translation inhibitor RaiA
MYLDIQTRGFPMTPAIEQAVRHEAAAYLATFPGLPLRLKVRLFDVNGRRGGLDKGCLVHAHAGRAGTVVVESDLDDDLYRAVSSAFVRLARATRARTDRRNTMRRAQPDPLRPLAAAI